MAVMSPSPPVRQGGVDVKGGRRRMQGGEIWGLVARRSAREGEIWVSDSFTVL
jgi:hypothetical protein